ncbi:segregation and condensation protein A [Blastopirellula retiformator]|uniref:Segregation and condensation protein A n=1 Tax=Blastopirellula retiformator TaxID=2527970 RepID=A0A5C5V2Y2_9BACT|nr:segregation/condensation protein A [Blastopirellula retiformator]TWT32741.1 Segregation and condensation protein A [Blastopirellula retiformator]
MKFKVDIDVYRGPLDLLLYLVRKHEIDIRDIPIAMITEQYVLYLDIIQQMDVDAAADFLEMASTLVEIKSKLLLPGAETDEELIDDPREQLVERLLEYKRFKDAAGLLDDQGRAWNRRFSRLSDDLPPRRIDPAQQPIHEVELWDLVSALTRIVRDSKTVQPTNIVYDDTPIRVYMERIHQRIVNEEKVSFTSNFEGAVHKVVIIGLFLAVLELVRHCHVVAQQPEPHGEIYLSAGDGFNTEFTLTDVDDYSSTASPEQVPSDEETNS